MFRDFMPGAGAVKGSRNEDECRPRHDAGLKLGAVSGCSWVKILNWVT